MDTFYERFKQLFGKPCWGVKIGYGTILNLEFGEPVLKVGKVTNFSQKVENVSSGTDLESRRRQAYVRGVWSLCIHSCDWDLHIKNIQPVRSSMGREVLTPYLTWLNGQWIVDASIDATGSIHLDFDLGASLSTSLSPGSDEKNVFDMWSLSQPNSMILECGSNKTWSEMHLRDDPDQVEWLPL